MSKYMRKYSAATLIENLADKGLTTDKEIANFIIAQQQEPELSLYLKILLGVAAFIASLCFIGFLSIAGIISFSHKIELIIWGLIFVAGAIGLLRIAGDNNTMTHSFLVQSSFASMAVGKTLFVFGVSMMQNSVWGASLALLLITGATYPLYSVSIDRFLSSFATLFSILVNILWDSSISSSRELLANGLFFTFFVGSALLLTNDKVKRDYIPLSYAFVFSLFVPACCF
jgi:Domain of unknown function (DUF4401)